MSRIVALIVILFFSCRGSSVKETQSTVMADSARKAVVAEDKDLSCGQLVSDLVQSSNAFAIGHFAKELVKSRIAYMTPDKATIKLYVINDISETPSEERLVENAVGWLEFYRQTGKLLDITNDPDKPVILKYDKAILAEHDLFKLCSPEVAVAKPGTGYETPDVMLADDIRFNDKLKRFFTMGEFEKVFGKPDSIKLLAEEVPCNTIFGTEAPDDKYLYKSGSRFETSGDSVAVDEFWFLNGNFITYKGIRIDANTTMQHIQQLFPTAVKGRLGMDKEGKLWVIQLREDEKGISDGQIKMFFRNGKVSFMHWWFPC
ncbi:hypothetical protein FAZ15_01210 [Sphingobacterium olei]|uniref:Uncharacterized protein n=1 Tax=Sphingobacterium olei TaxID=2571155 RepID=A0A4U0P6N4_9SPHI|nr:hypothetical protein [Sphingobacterium olei]TJZ62950.1 hypothetical protein FAZ15_01210 [Sphingobacterium olei]